MTTEQAEAADKQAAETSLEMPGLPLSCPADSPEGYGGDDDATSVVAAAFPTNAAAFIPDTEQKVDWVLSKIADARSRAARVRENAELIAREHDREAEGLEWRFGPALQAWIRAELTGSKKKSRRLLNGTLGYRTKPASVCVTDDAAALAWARENLPSAVAERLDKKVLGETLLANGEVLPFAVLVPADETFYIK